MHVDFVFRIPDCVLKKLTMSATEIYRQKHADIANVNRMTSARHMGEHELWTLLIESSFPF